MNRRNFLKYTFHTVAALIIGREIKEMFLPSPAQAIPTPGRWGFLVDTFKCIGCGFCVQACKLENGIPLEANVSRTWIERYLVTAEETFIDAPKEGRLGFLDIRLELKPGKSLAVPKEKIKKAFFVPKLCNQCAKPPCVQVCPVGATYQTIEGITLVDRQWCIGCGYCIMACPYGMRFFHPLYHVADKCNFCYHRLKRNLQPACVQACPMAARLIGNLRNEQDPVTRTILGERVAILKSEYGTKPQVYYLGLSEEVR
ncbi:MAG: 4Fe-4S dicluster domain-containing protein [Thermodesulfobacteriota bacterium]